MFNRVSTPDPRTPATAPTLPPSGGAPAHQPAQPIKSPPPFNQAMGATPTQQRQGDTPTSVLGQDITISGQQLVLKTKGSLLIAGRIEGEVHGESVTVGETGSVTGTIVARNITVQGEVNGALKGSAVVLNSTSRVEGDIIKQSLAISEGAQFDGSVRRAKDPAEVTPELG